jgi:hypothetical protein
VIVCKEGIGMGYEIFEKTIRRDTEPRVTISSLGRLQFNASASKILDRHAVETVLLLWDKDARKVGVKSISKKDERSYQMRYAKKGKGAGFAARTFLEWCGYDYSETKGYPCEWNEAEAMFEVSLPPAEAQKTPQRFPRLAGKVARGEGEAKGHARATV